MKYLRHYFLESFNSKTFSQNYFIFFLRTTILFILGIFNHFLLKEYGNYSIHIVFSQFLAVYFIYFVNEIYFEKGNLAFLWNPKRIKLAIFFRVMIHSLDYTLVIYISAFYTSIVLNSPKIVPLHLCIITAFSTAFYLSIIIDQKKQLLVPIISLGAMFSIACLFDQLWTCVSTIIFMFTKITGRELKKKLSSGAHRSYRKNEKISETILAFIKKCSVVFPPEWRPIIYKDLYYFSLNYFNYFRILLNSLVVIIFIRYFSYGRLGIYKVTATYLITMIFFSEIPLSVFLNFEKQGRYFLKTIPVKTRTIFWSKLISSGLIFFPFSILNCFLILKRIPFSYIFSVTASFLLFLGVSFFYFKRDTSNIRCEDNFSFSSILYEQTPIFEKDFSILFFQTPIIVIFGAILFKIQ